MGDGDKICMSHLDIFFILGLIPSTESVRISQYCYCNIINKISQKYKIIGHA